MKSYTIFDLKIKVVLKATLKTWLFLFLINLSVITLLVASSVNTYSNTFLVEQLGFESNDTAWTIFDGKIEGQLNNIGGGIKYTVVPNGSKMLRLAPSTNINKTTVTQALNMSSTDITYFDNLPGNPTNFAYAYIDITFDEPTDFSLAWNYIATDFSPYNDGTFVSFVPLNESASTPMINGVFQQISMLGATVKGTSSARSIAPYTTDDYGTTGWQSVDFKVLTPGQYRLGFAAYNLNDTLYSPILLVDHLPGEISTSGNLIAPIQPDPFGPLLSVTAGDTLTYDANGGFGQQADPNTYISGSSITVLGPGTMTKLDHTFAGWNTQIDGSGTKYLEGDVIAVDDDDFSLTLYAQWSTLNLEVTIPSLPDVLEFVYTGESIEISLETSENYSITGQTATTVGDYVVSLTLNDANAIWSDGTSEPILISWKILKATYDLSETSWDYTEPFVYNATQMGIELSNLPAGLTPIYVNHQASQAGIYEASVTFIYDEANFNTPTFEGITWEIIKATYDLSNTAWLSTTSFVYDGNIQTMQLTALPSGLTPVYVNHQASQAGIYEASVTFIYDEANFNTPTFEGITWEITKATYDLSNTAWLSTTSFVYDSNVQTMQLTALPPGLTPVYVNHQASQAGIYEASVTFIYDEANYNTPTFEGITWEITKATYDLSNTAWLSTTSFVYDSNVQNMQLTNLPPGLTPVYVNHQASQAGIYEASVTFVYDEANFNTPTFESITWEIIKATYDLSNTAWNYAEAYVYNATLQTVALTNLPPGLTPVYVGHQASQAGIYEASVTFIYDTANFNTPSFEGISWEIIKATYDLSNTAWDYTAPFVYNANVQRVLLTGLPLGLTPVYQSNLGLNAGRYQASVTFIYDTANFETPSFDPIRWEIQKTTYSFDTVRWSGDTFVFDGSMHTVTLDNLPAGVNAHYVQHQASQAGVYTASVTFTYDARNYLTPTFPDRVWEITKGTYDLSDTHWVVPLDLTYDGTDKILQLNGLPEGLSATLESHQASQAGIYEASVTFIYDALNYETPTFESVTWEILKATYDLANTTWDYAEPFAWDGSLHRVTLSELPLGLDVLYEGHEASQPGTYLATVRFLYDDINYESPSFESLSWTIAPAYTLTVFHPDRREDLSYFAGDALPALTSDPRYGYRFHGFFEDDNTPLPSQMPARDVVVRAHYQPLESLLDVWTAEGHERFRLITDELSPALPDIPVPQGWVFVGYFSAPLAFGSRIDTTTVIQHADHHLPYPYWFNPAQVRSDSAVLGLFPGPSTSRTIEVPQEVDETVIPWMNLTLSLSAFAGMSVLAWKGKRHG